MKDELGLVMCSNALQFVAWLFLLLLVCGFINAVAAHISDAITKRRHHS